MKTDHTTELDRVTAVIVRCARTVADELGPGFLKEVYENALAHELRKARLSLIQHRRIKLYYDGVMVGEHVADMVIEGIVVAEIKAMAELNEIHLSHCRNGLFVTGLPIGLLINFASKLQIERFVGTRASIPQVEPAAARPARKPVAHAH